MNIEKKALKEANRFMDAADVPKPTGVRLDLLYGDQFVSDVRVLVRPDVGESYISPVEICRIAASARLDGLPANWTPPQLKDYKVDKEQPEDRQHCKLGEVYRWKGTLLKVIDVDIKNHGALTVLTVNNDGVTDRWGPFLGNIGHRMVLKKRVRSGS
jgi:hypothetical protein